LNKQNSKINEEINKFQNLSIKDFKEEMINQNLNIKALWDSLNFFSQMINDPNIIS